MGTTLATELLRIKPDVAVALLDKEGCGCEASGLSAGTIWSAGHQVAPMMISESGASPLNEVMAESADFYESLQRAGYDAGWVRSGNLILAASDAELTHLKGEAEDLRANGYACEFLASPERVLAVEPSLAGGCAKAALHTRHSGYCEPLQATQAAATLARERGAVVVEGAGARAESVAVVAPDSLAALRGGRGGAPLYRVTTAGGHTYFASTVVVAAGIGCSALLRPLGLNVPVFPVKGTMWESNEFPAAAAAVDPAVAAGAKVEDTALPAALRCTIYVAESGLAWAEMYRGVGSYGDGMFSGSLCPPRYLTHDAAGRTVVRHCYGRPRADGAVVFGGSRQLVTDPSDCEADSGAADAVFAHVAELYPDVRTVGRSGGLWCGLMPFSADGLPLVGCLGPLGPPYGGLWLAGGFGGEGMMLGPGTAKLLAAQILCEGVSSITNGTASGNSWKSETAAEAHLRSEIMRQFDPCRPSGVTARPPVCTS